MTFSRRKALIACLILVSFASIANACGGSARTAAPTAAPAETPAPGVPRFLITSPKGLSERAGASDKVLVRIDPGFFVIDPAVSPDGKKIAYALQLPAKAGADGKVDFGTDLYVSNRDGSEPKLVAKHSSAGESIQKPNWLPNGKELVFEVLGVSGAGQSDFRIETVNLDSGAHKRVIEGAIEPALAPDGHTLAYVRIDPLTRFESLYVGDIAGGPDRRVVPPNLTLTFYVSTTWSPDGARLAFAAANPGTAMLPAKPGTPAHPTLQDVWVVNKDGTGLHLVAELAESVPSISWTPDNASVYVLGGGGFWLVDMTSGAKQPAGDGIAQGQVWLLR